MSDLRGHPDYILGYEDRWYRRRPLPAPSAAYSAGYDGARRVGEMFRELGYEQDAVGEWRPRNGAARPTLGSGNTP